MRLRPGDNGPFKRRCLAEAKDELACIQKGRTQSHCSITRLSNRLGELSRPEAKVGEA